VRELCQVAFGHLGLDYEGYVKQDPRFLRPADVDLLVSDPAKAKSILGWKPKVSFEELIVTMVEADLKRLQAESLFP
jgi:GDPmannose 4,6-dehydratase